MELVKISNDNTYELLKEDSKYFFRNTLDDTLLKTPNGKIVSTMYLELAERILNDVSTFGYDIHNSKSILSWHFTLIENFINMSKEEIVILLFNSFCPEDDWTYSIHSLVSKEWGKLLGNSRLRVNRINKWLYNCTYMQITAACCIANVFSSLNLSFVLAQLLETYDDTLLEEKFIELARILKNCGADGSLEDIVNEFKTFKLYYGIHLKENGKVINK